MKKVAIKFCIIAGATLVLATIIFLIVFLNRSVTVPDVTGIRITRATKKLDEAGLKSITSLEYSDTVEKDRVIFQNKKGGTKEKYGTEVTLVVSKGKEQVTLPDVINCSVAEAEATLKKLGFLVNINERFSDTVDKGNVIAQSVSSGKQADKGSSIVLTISKGPDLVIVPNIRGMSLEEAEQTLKNAGLLLKTEIRFSNNVKEGYIISQDIEFNQQVKRNSVVNAKISAGVSNKVGTTSSNANSYGMITTQGDWIYFSSSSRAIYRMRKDRSEIQSILNSPAVCINVIGEWIYFVDGAVGGIHKVKIDGTEKTKISNVTSYKVYVEGDWIYYTSEFWGGKLYKMKTDGSSVTQITDENGVDYIINGEYIYYINSSNYLVYKCRTNGNDKTIVCAGFGGTELVLVGQKLVTVNGYNIQSVNLDGSGFTSFGTTNVQKSFINGYDGWVYYLEHDFRNVGIAMSTFCRIKPDGSQKTSIFKYEFLNHANYYLNVADNWIYFKNEHDGDTLYRVKIDGTSVERVG